MYSAAQSPVVTAPRKSLTSSQYALLKELDRIGPAIKARNGWMLGGRFHRSKTFAPLVQHGLAVEDFRFGRHTMRVTYAGRIAVTPAPRTPGD